jgi:predicted N-acetyltransferase YhbS
MTDFEIRPYDHDRDFSDVEALLIQGGLYDPDRDTETRLSQFSDSILVADEGVEVVGSIYVVNHIVPMLFRLVVDRSRRRQGVGRALIEAGITKLKSEGAKDVEIFVDAEKVNLKRYYERLGFNDGGQYSSMWRYTNQPESSN